MAADATQLICRSDELAEKGAGVRFVLAQQGGGTIKGFAIRYHGRVYAFQNACRHVPVELDLMEGHFFDASGAYLVCSMHGALYAPDSGLCVAGPCKGARLLPLDAVERDGEVWIGPPIGSMF
jgi:nitrite reductase/ring-hydroxylating ferredoxin subunit